MVGGGGWGDLGLDELADIGAIMEGLGVSGESAPLAVLVGAAVSIACFVSGRKKDGGRK